MDINTEISSYYYLEGTENNLSDLPEATTKYLNGPENKKRDIHCCFKLNEGQPYQDHDYNYNSEQLKQIDLKIEDKKKKGSPLKETSIEMILTKNKLSRGPFKEKYTQKLEQAESDEMQPFQIIIKNDTKNKQLSNTQGMKEFNKLYNLAKVDKNKNKWDKQIKKLYEIISEEKKEIERNKTTYSSMHKMLENKFYNKNEEPLKVPTNEERFKGEWDAYFKAQREKVPSTETSKVNRAKEKYQNDKYSSKDRQRYQDLQRIHQQLEPKPMKGLIKHSKAHRLANILNSYNSRPTSSKYIKSKYQTCMSKFRDDLLKEEMDEKNNETSSYSNDKEFYIEGIKFNNDQLNTILQALDNKLENENVTNNKIIYSEPMKHYNEQLVNNSDQIKAKLLKKCENIKSNISYILNLMNDLQDEGRSNPESMNSCLQSTEFDNLLNNLRKFNQIQYYTITNGKDFDKLKPENTDPIGFQKQNPKQHKNDFGINLRGTSKEDSEALKEIEALSNYEKLVTSEATLLDEKLEDFMPWRDIAMSTIRTLENIDKSNISSDSINSKSLESNVTSIDDEIHLKIETETENKKDSFKDNYLNDLKGNILDNSPIKKPTDQMDEEKIFNINEKDGETLQNKNTSSPEVSLAGSSTGGSTESLVKMAAFQENTSEKNANLTAEKEQNFPHESILDNLSGKSIIKLVQKETPDLFLSVDKVSTTASYQESSKEEKGSTKTSILNVTNEPYMIDLGSFPLTRNLFKFNKYRGGRRKFEPNRSAVFDMSRFNKIANRMQDIPHKVSMPIIIDILNSLMYNKGSEQPNDDEETSDKRLKRQNYGHYINIPATKDIEINMKVKKGKRKKTKKYKSSYNKLMKSKMKKANKFLLSKKRFKEKIGQAKKNRLKQIYMPNFKSRKGMRIVPPFLFGDSIITINVTPCETFYKSKKNMKFFKKPYSSTAEHKSNETSMVAEKKYFMMSNVKGDVTERPKIHHETQLRLPLRFFRFKLGNSAMTTEGLRRKYSTPSPLLMTEPPLRFETNDNEEREMIKSALQEFKGKTLAQLKVPWTTSMPFMKSRLENQDFRSQLEKMKAIQELSLINKMSERAFDFLKRMPTQKTFTPMEIANRRTLQPMTESTFNISKVKEHEFTFTVTLKPHNPKNPNESDLRLSTILPPLENLEKTSSTSPLPMKKISDVGQEEKSNEKFNKILDLDYDMDYFSTETQSEALKPNTVNNLEVTKVMNQNTAAPENMKIEKPHFQPNYLQQIVVPLTTESIPVPPLPTQSLLTQTISIPKYTEFNFNSQEFDELKIDEPLTPSTEPNTVNEVNEETETLQPIQEENPPLTESLDDLILNFDEQTEEITESEKDVFMAKQEDINQSELEKEQEIIMNTENINPPEMTEANQQEDDTTEMQYDDELETVMESFGEKPKLAPLYQPPRTTETATDNIPESEHEDILNDFLEFEISSQDPKLLKLDEVPETQYNFSLKEELTKSQPQKETTNQDTDERDGEESNPIEKEQNYPTEKEQNFPIEKQRINSMENHRNYPIEKEQNYPIEKEQNFPEEKEQNYPIEKEQNFPIEKEENFPVEKEQNFPIEKQKINSMENHRNYLIEKEQNYPSDKEQNYPSEKEQNYPPENEQNFLSEKEQNYPSEKEILFTTREENEFSAAPALTTAVPSDEEINKVDLNDDRLFTDFEENEDNDDESKEEDEENKDEDLDEGESIHMMELTDVTTQRQSLMQFAPEVTSKTSVDVESDNAELDSNDFQDLLFWQNVTRKLDREKQPANLSTVPDMALFSTINQSQPNVTETNVTVDIHSMKLELEQLKELLDKSPLANKMNSLKNLVESSNMNFTQNDMNEKAIKNSFEESTMNKEDDSKKLTMSNAHTNELAEAKVNETTLAEKNMMDEVDREMSKFDTENLESTNSKSQDTDQEITTYLNEKTDSIQDFTDKSILNSIDELEFEIENSPPVSVEKENENASEEPNSIETEPERGEPNPSDLDTDALETLQNIDKDKQDFIIDSTNEAPIDDTKILDMADPNDTSDDENSNLLNVEIKNGTDSDVRMQKKIDLDNDREQLESADILKENQWNEKNYTNLEEFKSSESEETANNTKSNDPNSVILLDNVSNDPTRWVLHDDSFWQIKPWDHYKPLENDMEDSLKNFLRKERILNNLKMADDSKYLKDRDNILNFLRSNGLRDNFIHHSNKFGKITKEPLLKRNQSRHIDQNLRRTMIRSRNRSNKNPNAAYNSPPNSLASKDKFGTNKNMSTITAGRNNSGIQINRRVVGNKVPKNYLNTVKKLNVKKSNIYNKSKSSNKAQVLRNLNLKSQVNSTVNRKSVNKKNNLIQGKEYLSKTHGSSTNVHNKNESKENNMEIKNKNHQLNHAQRKNNRAKIISSISCPSCNQFNRRQKNKEKSNWQKVNHLDQLGNNYNKIDKLYDWNMIRKNNHNYQKNAFLTNPKLPTHDKSVINNFRKSNQKSNNFFKQRLNKKMNQLRLFQNKNKKDTKITPEEERKIKLILDGIICRYKGCTNDTEEENFMRFKANKLNTASKKNMTKIKSHNKFSKIGQKTDKAKFKLRSKYADPRQQHQRFFTNNVPKKQFSIFPMFSKLTKNYRRADDLSVPLVKANSNKLLNSEPELQRHKKNYLIGQPIIRTIPNRNSPGFMSVINTQVKKLPNATNIMGTNHNKGNLQYKMDDGLDQMTMNEMLRNHTGNPIHGILSLVYPEDITNNMTQNNDYNLGGGTGYSGNINDAGYSAAGINLNNQVNNKQFDELLTSLERDNITDNAKYKEIISLLRENQKEAGRNKSREEEELRAKVKAIKWMVNFKNGQAPNKMPQIKADSFIKQEGSGPGQVENKEKEDDVESMKKFITKYKVLLKMFEEQHGKLDMKDETQKLSKNRDELQTKEGSMLVQRPMAVNNIWKKTKGKERIQSRIEEGTRNLLLDNTSKRKNQKMYLIGQNKQRKELESPIEDIPDSEGSYIIKHLQDDDDYDNLENCNDIEIESYDDSLDKIKDDTGSQILPNGTGFMIKDSSHLQSLPSGLFSKYKTVDKYKGYHGVQTPTRPKSRDEPSLKLNSTTINKMFKTPISPISYIGEVTYDKCKTNWDNWTLDRTPPSAKLKQQVITDEPQVNMTQDHMVPVVQAAKDDDKEVMIHTNDNVLMLPIKFNTTDFMKLLNYKEVNDSESGYQEYEPSGPSRKTKLWDGDNRSSYIFDVDKGGPNSIKNRYYITFDSLSPNTVKVKNVSTIPVSNFSNFVNKGNPNLNVVSIRKVISPWDKMNMSHSYINNKNVKGYLRPEIRSIEKVCLWLRKPLSYNLTHQVPKVAISLGEVWPPMAEGQGPRNMKHYLVQVDPLITPSKYPNQHIDYPSQISKVVWKAILHGFKTPKKAWQLTNQLG